MKKLYTIAIAAFPVILYSQVGINTQNPQGIFHIDGAKDNALAGVPTTAQQYDDFLVTNTGRLGLGTNSPTVKLEINTNSVNGGIRILDGTQASGKVLTSDANGVGTWQNISAWSTAGNNNIDATAINSLGTKFIGTTDGHSFVVKTNNTLAAYIGSTVQDNLSYGINAGVSTSTGNYNIFIGNNAGSQNVQGSSNVMVGPYAGNANTTGNSNTFFGYNAGSKNVTGDSNAFIGTWAGNNNTSGANNSFLGYTAGNNNSTGNNNIFVGNSAGQTITTGSNNTFLGTASDATVNNITNATAIGYNAKASMSNTMILGGEGTLAVNVGIGTSTPASRLEVDGSATNKSAFNAGSSTAIDFSKSNLAYTNANPSSFTLSNIKDGGTYTLSVRGTTSGTSSFTASGYTVKYVHNTTTVSGKETLYSLMVMGSTLYVHMISGF